MIVDYIDSHRGRWRRPICAVLAEAGISIAPSTYCARSIQGRSAVCLRFLDQDGNLINSQFNTRVLAITPDQLKAVPRRTGIAGGPEKKTAIAAAVKDGWINTLITDLDTAQHLLCSRRSLRRSALHQIKMGPAAKLHRWRQLAAETCFRCRDGPLQQGRGRK
jgi:Putative sugar-binding domain